MMGLPIGTRYYPYATQLAPLFVAAGELAATVRAGAAQHGGEK